MSYKRQYKKGEQITSLDELAKQKFVYVSDKITHCGWFMSWQVTYAERLIKKGVIHYAVKNDE